MLINVGEAYIVVNIINGPLTSDLDVQDWQVSRTHHIRLPDGYEEEDDRSKLKMKIVGGPSAGEVFFFKHPVEKEIVLGRTPDCNVRINDKLLSKNQATVRYSEQSDQWVLCDGFCGKPSTNGTWLYLNEDYQMHSGMVFKANQTIFNV